MRNAKVAIVTTSINEEPTSYQKWGQQGTIVCAGDLNTPGSLKDYVEAFGGHYLDPGLKFPGYSYVPFRCIQRRNAAIWEAYMGGYDAAILVDDDNTPAQDYFTEVLTSELGVETQLVVGSSSGFLNLGELCTPMFRQRGCPYGINTSMRAVQIVQPAKVVVAQAMVLGDPDCDAIERMVNAPNVMAVTNRIRVKPGTFTAFNSQATAWTREWLPVSAVLPNVGRYDDIFAAFIFSRMSRTYNVSLYAGDPVVVQERNPHDLVKDLKAETFGMSIVFDFCRALDEAYISDAMPLWLAYGELITAVSHLLPAATVRFAQEWAAAWSQHA